MSLVTTLVYLSLFLVIVGIWLFLKGHSVDSLFHIIVSIIVAALSVVCLIIACFV